MGAARPGSLTQGQMETVSAGRARARAARSGSLDPVEPAVAVIVTLALLGAVATIAAVRRDRDLERAQATIARLESEGAGHRRLDADRSADDDALHDTLDAGVIRLDAGLRIRDANPR